MTTRRSLAAGLVGVLLLAACLAGCGADKEAGASPTAATLGPRPSSPAKLAIVAPRNGATVPAAGAPLQLSLGKAKIVNVTTRNIKPDEGHIHVLVDDRLMTMNYQLKGELRKLGPGTHLVKVEFVAADHLPFDPRVLAQAAFVVK